MPYFNSSQEWFHQSSLLLEARPTTTRVTTKYTLSKPKKAHRRAQRRLQRQQQASSETPTESAEASVTPQAKLVLKTYDPESGVCLKYRTHKAPEVGRLVASLGRLGRRMAALPEREEAPVDAMEVDGGPAAAGGDEADGVAVGGGQQQQQAATGGGGGGKKKKKGKK